MGVHCCVIDNAFMLSNRLGRGAKIVAVWNAVGRVAH